MGRIKTMPIKRATNQLVKAYPTAFKKSFAENKELVSKYLDTKSKKIRKEKEIGKTTMACCADQYLCWVGLLAGGGMAGGNNRGFSGFFH